MKQIVTHFTDNDLYTFTCMYYIVQNYPRAEVRYRFFDRNNTVYPKGFAELLQKQMDGMKDVVLTEEEAEFMKKSCYFLPEWFFTFLKGYRFNPKELSISQDAEGHLNITVEGKWYSAIMWEMPILSTVSELTHILNEDVAKRYDAKAEYEKSYRKMYDALCNGLAIADMGTRRRFSFDHMDNCIRAFTDASTDYRNKMGGTPNMGNFNGTSNVYFAMKYGLKCIGTMSHQIISFEETVSGVFECNNQVMEKWNNTYDSDNGIMLYDCFGDKLFFNNFSKKLAKAFDGLRVDSGDEKEQIEKIIAKYKYFGINPETKKVVFSNGLNIDKAIEIHKYCNGRLQDSYGIGTYLMCDVDGCKPSNIVVKLVNGRITENREWHDCVKLSCDKGKTLGNKEKCDYLIKMIG